MLSLSGLGRMEVGMPPLVFIRRSRVSVPAAELFDWHTRPGAFARLTPWWEAVQVEHADPGIRDGARVSLRTSVGPVPLRWELTHRDYVEGEQFRDQQLRGPFRHWVHTHRMLPAGPHESELEDQIDYVLPLGPLGKLLGRRFVERKLARLFRYRHDVTRADLAAHHHYQEHIMKIAVSGATGLVGSSLIPFLTTGGHEVKRLVRPSSKTGSGAAGDLGWDPAKGSIDAAGLEGLDAVVHLAGESIASGRWTDAKKRRIRDSRVISTRLLSETLAKLNQKPKVLVSASAIGFYGNREDELLTEASAPGAGFLADVCREWEQATEPAVAGGIRVVNLRFGVILAGQGGALKQMLTPFKLGVGGRIGSGRQFMSWITLDDVIGAIHHALMNDSVRGPVNTVAPRPVTNAEFTKTLGRVLGRPTIFPMPGFAAKLAFGEMADELLLSGQRVQPGVLLSSGYAFRHAELDAGLRHVLGR